MRLIDADAYPCAKCGSAYCITNCDKYWEWFNTTIDAEPVRHGRYAFVGPHIGTLFAEHGTCRVCGERILIDPQHKNYCPNCGAKMDGDINALD